MTNIPQGSVLCVSYVEQAVLNLKCSFDYGQKALNKSLEMTIIESTIMSVMDYSNIIYVHAGSSTLRALSTDYQSALF